MGKYDKGFAGAGLEAPPAADNLAAVNDIAPDAAATAYNNETDSDIPAPLGMHDPAVVNRMAVAARARAISLQNPAVATWAQSPHPQVAATQDDFDSLDKISRNVGGWFAHNLVTPTQEAWRQLQATNARIAAGATGPTEAGNVAKGIANLALSPISGPFNALVAEPGAVALDQAKFLPVFPQHTFDPFDFAHFFDNQPLAQPSAAERHASNVGLIGMLSLGLPGLKGKPAAAAAEAEGAAGAAGPKPSGPAPRPSVFDPQFSDGRYATEPDGAVSGVQFGSQKEAANWIIKEGHKNSVDQIFEVGNGAEEGTYIVRERGRADIGDADDPVGVSAGVDGVRTTLAEADAERAKELESLVASSKTFGRSPQIMREFLDQQVGDRSVWVDPQGIAELYSSGQSAFTARLPEFQSAMQRGASVEMPLAEYLTEAAGKPWADGLRKHVRFREDGVSQAEAEGLTASAEAQAEAPEFRMQYGKDLVGGATWAVRPTSLDEHQTTTGLEGVVRQGGQVWSVRNANLPEEMRGQGIGSRMYEHAANEAAKTGAVISSDAEVSQAAARVWRGLKAKGYPVRENPNTIVDNTLLGADGKSVFEMERPGGEVRLPAIPEGFSEEEAATIGEWLKAAQPALAKQARAVYLQQMFKDAKSMGMTKTQFNGYSRKIEAAIEAAQQRLLERMTRQVKKERETPFKEALAQNVANVEQAFFNRQDIQAWFYLRHGQHPNGAPLEGAQKLNRAAVEKRWPGMVPDAWLSRQGVDPEGLASTLGYDMASQMLREATALETAANAAQLTAKQYLSKVVKGQAQNITRAELGFDMSPAGLRQAASEALAGPDIEGLLTDEMAALAKQAGDEPISKEMIRDRAQQMFDKLRVKDAMNLKEFERVYAKLGRDAETALLKGDASAAFKNKQTQLLNYHMMTMAHALVKDFRRTTAKWQKRATQPTHPSIDQGFLNYIHAALMNMGYKVRRNQQELLDAIGDKTLDEFVKDWENAGQPIVLGDLSNDLPENSTVDSYNQTRDTLDSLEHVGRLIKGVDVLGKRLQLEVVLSDIEARNAGRKIKKPSEQERKTLAGTLGRGARGINAAMLNGESIADDIDRNDLRGPLNQTVIDPLQAGKAAENDMRTRVTKELRAFMKDKPDLLGSMKDKIEAPEVVDAYGDQRITTRGELIRYALNWGNKSNRAKLLQGYGTELGEAEAMLRREMRPEDWALVQHIWDQYETLRPEIEKVYRDLTGIAPTWIKSTPFDLGVPMKGGYFPIVYDKYRGGPEARSMSSESLWGDEYNSALPANPYTKNRTNFVGPLALNFEGITAGLSQQIHDIAFRKPLLQASRVLLNPRVQKVVQDTLGKEYRNQLRPWLQYAARNQVYSEQATEWAAAFIRNARVNMTNVGLMYRVMSAQKHLIAATSDSIGEVGVPRLAGALFDMLRSPGQFKYWMDYANEHSAELRHRGLNMDREIREQVDRLVQKQGFLAAFQHYGFHMIALSDSLSAYPTWLAALKRATEEGYGPDEAHIIADKAVRMAHGASAPVDLPAFQRSGHGALGEVGRTSTSFLSFMNHAYNRQWRTKQMLGQAVNEARDGDWQGAKRDFTRATARTFWYLLAPAILMSELEALREGKLTPGVEQWIGGLAHQGLGAIPGVGAIIDVATGRSASTSPLNQMIETTVATLGDALDVAKGDTKHVSKRWLQHSLETAGYWTGIGTGQVGATSQFYWNWMTGKEKVRSITDAVRGTLYGPKPKARHHK